MSKLPKIEVLHEDNHLIIINKKSGDIVQGDKTGDQPLNEIVKEYIKIKHHKPGEVYLGTPHRLDRPTSGIIVFSKTSKALARLNKMFHDKEVQKTYWAIVKNKPKNDSDKLVHFLKKNNQKNRSYAHLKKVDGAKRAELDYKLIHSFDNYHLLEIKPITGRHHQIRVQLNAIGSTIKGDLKYGFPRSNPDASISLHARSIEFIHPVSKELLKISCCPISKDVLWKEACQIFK